MPLLMIACKRINSFIVFLARLFESLNLNCEALNWRVCGGVVSLSIFCDDRGRNAGSLTKSLPKSTERNEIHYPHSKAASYNTTFGYD